MADPAGEIDLDSVIDRLLEGKIISIHLRPHRVGLCSPSFTDLTPLWFALSILYQFHLLVRGNRPGKAVQLQEFEIKYLCTKAREIFINQPILLELEAPIKICGKFPKLLPHRAVIPDPPCFVSIWTSR